MPPKKRSLNDPPAEMPVGKRSRAAIKKEESEPIEDAVIKDEPSGDEPSDEESMTTAEMQEVLDYKTRYISRLQHALRKMETRWSEVVDQRNDLLGAIKRNDCMLKA